ncbi:MAG TPA: hypothetical protein VKG24_00545 [Pseudolabrys sp.]|jgi:hypothetical protein|nr:hypothetical protein [Pseudolabrys sp.]
MSLVSITRVIITAVAALALAQCMSDPNNLGKRTGLAPPVSINHAG